MQIEALRRLVGQTDFELAKNDVVLDFPSNAHEVFYFHTLLKRVTKIKIK